MEVGPCNIIMEPTNLTPHDIRVYKEDDGSLIRTFPASGSVCRCVAVSVEECNVTLLGVPVISAPSFSDVQGLPGGDFEPDILVSMPVGDFLRNHPDRYGGAVFGPEEDETGAIKGTFRLLLYKDRE